MRQGDNRGARIGVVRNRLFGSHPATDALAEAALRSMDQDCGRIDDDGAVSYREASCLANVWAVEAKLMRTGDFRNSFVKGPAASAFTGPQLAEASYPEVLVAKATSTGNDLDLVLYPGRGNGRHKLGLARLAPGASYRIAGRPDLDFRADDARNRDQVLRCLFF